VQSEGKILKFPIIFKSAGKNEKKKEGKTGILTKNWFSRKSILVVSGTLKQMTVDT